MKLAICLLLLISVTVHAQAPTFDRELLAEKRLEDRINQALSTFLKVGEFILIADIKVEDQAKAMKDAAEKGDYFEEQAELKGLDLKLPGVIDAPFGFDDAGLNAEGEPSGTGAKSGAHTSKIILTLFLDNDVPDTKMELIQAIIVKTAQLDLNRGDELNIRVIDFGAGVSKSEAQSLAQDPSANRAQSATPSAKLSDNMSNDKLLMYGLIGLLLLVLIGFFLVLFRGRQVTVNIPSQDQNGRSYPQTFQTTPAQTPAPSKNTASEPAEQADKQRDSSKDVPKLDMAVDRLKQEAINLMFARPEAVVQAIDDLLRDDGGLRQVSALVKAFGPETARTLFTGLDSATVNKVYSYFVTVDTWNDGEIEGVLGRFSQMLRNHQIQSIVDISTNGPFGFVKKMTDEEISYLIKGEEIPVLALFLAHLAPQRAAKVLAKMDRGLSSAVAAEIGNLKYVNADIINAVGRRLAEKSLLMPRFDFYPGTGLNTLVQILDNLDPSYEKMLLASLKEQDSQIAKDLKKVYFAFDDIISLSKDSLKIILKEIPRSILATALVGASPAIQQTIIEVLPERRAEMMKFDMEKQQNAPAGDISKAQKAVVAKIRGLIQSGEIEIGAKTDKNGRNGDAGEAVNGQQSKGAAAPKTA